MLEDVWSMLQHGLSGREGDLAVCQEGEENMTYADLHAEIRRSVALLSAMSVERGSRIGVMMPNDCRVMLLHFAAAACR